MLKKQTNGLENQTNYSGEVKALENPKANLEKNGNCHICKKKKNILCCYTQNKSTSCL